ncbi:MAG: ABC transporter permease [Clostridia bacterium]|nr:ABC transporter permease [Clostridia bacterium]
MKVFSKIYNAIIFTILYAPILMVIVFSFNSSKRTPMKWKGFTFDWYASLFQKEEILNSLWITLQVAIIATIAATIIGTLASIGIHGMNRKLKKAFLTVNQIPMVNPEIVTAVAFMLLFVSLSVAIPILKPGFVPLCIAHVTFCIPYVVLQIMPKLRQMNTHLYEAALDLGCTPVQAFFKVVLPEIMPGILTGALMAFTISLDDFAISYFTSGSTAQTLSVTIYSMVKRPVTPEIYALSALLFGTVMILLLFANIGQIKSLAQKSRRSTNSKLKRSV